MRFSLCLCPCDPFVCRTCTARLAEQLYGPNADRALELDAAEAANHAHAVSERPVYTFTIYVYY